MLAIVGALAASAFDVGIGPAASATPRLLRYRVTHSSYGDIGTYSNSVAQSGDTTTVETEVHLKVSILGVVFHREDSQRTERWAGDRLVYFHGVTTKNNQAVEVQGEARGDGFVIKSPLGTFVAPASVRPANPWSAKFLGSDTMMRVDTGKIEQVHISPPQNTTMTIGGAALRVREYQIACKTPFKIWLDDNDVPVKFSIDDDTGVVTFTLIR